jgi:hypothetical protein
VKVTAQPPPSAEVKNDGAVPTVLRADLDYMEKLEFFILPGLELRPLGRPARKNHYTVCATAAL